MRTFVYVPVAFLVMLVACLTFAPVRTHTIGDPELHGRPASSHGVIPKVAVKAPTKDRSFAELCQHDPLAAIAMSLDAYKKNVEGYSCTFIKRERIKDKLRPEETIAVDFQESPFAVLMNWKKGAGRAETILYAAGSYDDQLLIVPSGDFAKRALKITGKPYAVRGLTSADAMSSARYPANEFGFRHGTTRVQNAWQEIKDRGLMNATYKGLLPIKELDGKKCHVITRACNPPEEEGMTQITLYFDPETFLQVGSELKAGEELIAYYFFKDVRLNPKFSADHFKAERLK